MESDYRKGIVQQTSYYLFNGIIMVLASFISFPIWTRTLSLTEYGIMSIATTTVTIIVAFSKFGIQHAILRFYSEFKEKKRQEPISHFYTTALMGSIYIGLLVCGIYILVVLLFFTKLESTLKSVLLLIAAIGYLDNIKAICFMFLRAEQKARPYSILGIIDKYGQLILSLFFVLFFKKGVVGYFWGFILMDVIMSLTLLITYYRQDKINLSHFSMSLFKEMVSYGSPLIAFEFFNNINKWGDRYVIQYFLGPTAVALYSVPYNLSNMASNFFANPLRLSSMSVYMGIWEKEGKLATENFLGTLLKYYLVICVPIVVGFTVMAQDIIKILASTKYESSSNIVPYIILGTVLSQGYFIYGAGLYLKKLTKKLMYINLITSLVNICFNIYLVPKYGILGSAVTTLLTYIIFIFLLLISSMSVVRIRISFSEIIKPVVISIAMGIAILMIKGSTLTDIFIKSSIGFIIYCSGILILDESLRNKVRTMIQKVI